MTAPAPNDDLVREIEDAEWWERGDAEGNTVVSIAPESLAAAYRAQAERISVLERALEPFAKEARLWAGYDEAEILVEGFPNGPASIITVGDLYRARTTLTGAR